MDPNATVVKSEIKYMSAMPAKVMSLEAIPEVFAQQGQRSLVVGDLKRWAAAGRDTVSGGRIQYAALSDLTAELLEEFAPEIVLSPLFGDNFDVFEVATALHRFGFKGRYRAICVDVPNVGIIRAEIVAAAPDLDFDLLQVPSAQLNVASNDP